MKLVFKPLKPVKLPIDLSGLTPDKIEDMDLGEVRSLQVWVGNKRKRVDEVFSVEMEECEGGSGLEEPIVEFRGDLCRARAIGSRMEKGTIVVRGDGGLRLGEYMRGGSILVEGNVDCWAGMAMVNGFIHVKGSAGSYVGAAPKGSMKGMRGGLILVEGYAGDSVGAWMRGGAIEVKGGVGLSPGIHMRKGTIVVHGDCAGRPGACMKAGKIVLLGRVGSILPSFQIEEVRPSVKGVRERFEGPFYVFVGDLNEDGRGRLFVSKPSNPMFEGLEELLKPLARIR